MIVFLVLLHTGYALILIANLVYLRRGRRRRFPERYPRLSVLIPARNEAANLRRLLPSLAKQDHPDFEVLLYDDASEDDTWAVMRALQDPRFRTLRGHGPPPGWIGKVHALYQATRHATGTQYLFLDADTELRDRGALRRLAERALALPDDAVMTGFPRLRGGGLLLVSLVPSAILTGLPWPLVRRLPLRTLGAVNGQCWMIRAALYHRHEPHAHVRNEILEDVQIGRFLKAQGLTPTLRDVQAELTVYMYRDLGEAWRGLRKNAYLILGGRPAPFFFFHALFLLAFVLAPLFNVWLALPVYALKAATDRIAGFPLHLTLLAPLSYALGAGVQLDSAISHWRGRTAWKGRRVGPAAPPPPCSVASPDVD